MRKSKLVVRRLFLSVLILITIGVIEVYAIRTIALREINMNYAYTYEQYINTRRRLYQEYQPIVTNRTYKEYRELISKELNFYTYIYNEVDFKDKHDGIAVLPCFNIFVETGLDSYDYCTTFMHELNHIVEFSSQENYVDFMTFKKLYESEDEELHQYGIRFAFAHLDNNVTHDYNCSEKIIEYFSKN
jgi:hypothetical protein